MNEYQDFARAIRELNTTLSGVVKVASSDPSHASDYVAGFNSTFTMSGVITVWTPLIGTRYRVKRVTVCGVVDTLLAASKPVAFYLADGTSGEVVAPITAAAATAAEATLLPAGGVPIVIDLREGYPGSAAATTLVIKANATIGSGFVRFFGHVIGEEQTV